MGGRVGVLSRHFTPVSLSQWPILKKNQEGVNLADLFTIAFGALTLTVIDKLPAMGMMLSLWAMIFLIFGTGLGREHFFLSFVPRGKDVPKLANMVLLSIAIFLPLAIAVRFIDLANFTLDVSAPRLYVMVVNWAFIVGIGEELIFRSGLLVLFADWARDRGKKRPRLWGLVISSQLFGLGHASKGWNYAFLAVIEGFAYGLLFLRGRNLFGAIMLHMTVDVIAVAFFGALL